MYMDALGGFAGHYTKVERQVHRVLRDVAKRRDSTGMTVVTSASYEDPNQPDVVLYRIVRADDYLAANARGGSNEQQHARAIVVFLFAYWEDEIRPRLASAKGVQISEIKSDIMGDLRILRNAILHAKSIIKADEYKRLRKLQDSFQEDQPILLPYDLMQRIFVLTKQDIGRMMLEWLGQTNGPVSPEEIKALAIQFGRKPKK
jgi:hypothetical protein